MDTCPPMTVPATFPSTLPCPYAIVGEAPGAEEAAFGKPFIGASGNLLNSSLRKMGISRDDCLITNVFTTRPPANNVKHFFLSGHTLKDEYLSELDRLYSELHRAQPSIIIALGATALWALTGETKLTNQRGFLRYDKTNTFKMLASYHPAAILRDWKLRPWLLLDLAKARANADPSPIKWPDRRVQIPTTFSEATSLIKSLHSAPQISVDIETIMSIQQISTISLSPSPTEAIVIPLLSKTMRGWSVWAPHEEVEIIFHLAHLFSLPTPTKLFHNAIFDISHLHHLGVTTMGHVDDSMLLAHSLQPELPKALGQLGATYANERAWKSMRVRTKDEEKVEE